MVSPQHLCLAVAAMLFLTTTAAAARYSQEEPRRSGLQLLRYLLNQDSGEDALSIRSSGESDQQQQQFPKFKIDGLASDKRSAEVLPPAGKRFTEYGLPYYKYKRNNGIWIWMPAQGYVSVPKDQQALATSDAAKQGKIMRYGK